MPLDHGPATALRFNGKTWRSVRLGNVGSVLTADGVSAKDIWAITLRSDKKAMALHWNGKTWRSVALPKLPLAKGASIFPIMVRAASPRNAWLTAQVFGPHPFPVLFHWDGRSWRRVTVPGKDDLFAVASDGSGGAWVGAAADDVLAFLHYANGKWSRLPVPAVSSGTRLESASVYDIAAIPGTRSAWATADAFYLDKNGTDHGAAVIYKFGP